jgi:hypothetical protein
MATHLCYCAITHMIRTVRVSYIHCTRFLRSVVPHAHNCHTKIHLQPIHSSHQYETEYREHIADLHETCKE